MMESASKQQEIICLKREREDEGKSNRNRSRLVFNVDRKARAQRRQARKNCIHYSSVNKKAINTGKAEASGESTRKFRNNLNSNFRK